MQDDPDPSQRRGPTPEQLAPWALALLSLLPFLPALAAGFVDWDDPLTLVDNPHFRGLGAEHLSWMFTSVRAGHYMPLTWLTWGLDHALWGMDPFGYHLTNLLLHALATVFVQRIARRVLLAGGAPVGGGLELGAAAAALLFAWHPLRVEAVAWATGRIELVSGTLLFACVLAYLRSWDEGSRRRWLAISVLLYLGSLLGKATGMTLPAVLLMLDAWPGRRFAAGPDRSQRLRAALIEKVPFLVLGLGAGALAVAAKAAGSTTLLGLSEHGLLQRLAQAVWALAFYAQKTFVPLDLSPLYELPRDLDPFSAGPLMSALAVLVISLATLAVRRPWPALPFAWFTYVVLIAPVSGLVQSGYQAAADRYTYVACLPFALLVGAGLAWARRARPVWLAIAGGVLLALGAASFVQTRHWHDSESLWRHAIELDPGSTQARWHLGVVLHRSQRFGEAVTTYQGALAISTGADVDELHYNLALSELALGRGEAAEARLVALLARAPTHLGALRVLRDVYARRDRAQDFEALLLRHLERNPRFLEGWIELCDFELEHDRLDEAVRMGEQALGLDPDAPEAHSKLGLAHLYSGRFADAERHLRRLLELEPDSPAGHLNLGLTLRELGRPAEARALWTHLLELEPENEAARRQLQRLDSGE